MARIEIPIEEYQGLKNKIKSLEDALGEVSKDAALSKEKLEKIESIVMDLGEEKLIDRLFSWKKIIEPLQKLFPSNE